MTQHDAEERLLSIRTGARELGHDGESARATAPPPGWLNRRELLGLLAPTLAMLGGCIDPPREKIVPYVRRGPHIHPGLPLHYATSMSIDGFSVGLLVESREGRPVKVEGNPQHPASLGATSAFQQASVLSLYDPDRSRGVTRDGQPSSWAAFQAQVVDRTPSEGLWFVLPPESSPLVGALIERVQKRHPGARFVFHTPLARRGALSAARHLFGAPLDAHYRFRDAARILALDADFTAMMPMSLRWARDFAERRRLTSPGGEMNRLYVVEPMPTPTGSLADHRLALPCRDVARVAAGVLAEVLRAGAHLEHLSDDARTSLDEVVPAAQRKWCAAVARDLVAHPRESIIIAGDQQPESTHVLAHLLNAALGNVNHTVTLRRSAHLTPAGSASLDDLAGAIDQGLVHTLVLLDTNPVYTARADLELARRLRAVPVTAQLSLYRDETSLACHWSLPALHYLESWGDGRAYDGTVSLTQPLIKPLYAGRGTPDVLASFAGEPLESTHDRLREHHGAHHWEEHLQLGFVPDSAFSLENPATDWQRANRAVSAMPDEESAERLELHFAPSPKVYDGRFANNGWLQELPHPLTKLTWDNAAIVSPTDAANLGIETGQIVELRAGGNTVSAPALVLAGHASGSVTVALGYGRLGSESLARAVGFDVYPLRDERSSRSLELGVTARRHDLALTQDHDRMHGREIALHHSLAAYREDPDLGAAQRAPLPSLLPDMLGGAEQWAMSIDTTICTGCSSCVVACQAENNVPIVGRAGVLHGRVMHWLRIDLYVTGAAAEPAIIHQPMLCQHCEKAPCEYVCPVNATVHSPDGLNEMVYNRCVGTRFCSNNCPYKVRRFNWLQYTGESELLALQYNPDVTVRDRGVMEKCTYCVQRIRGAERAALLENRSIGAGEVVTACQQACPTGAITFGSLRHRDSEVVRWREEPRAYSVLHDQGTLPRTQYLAKITNPNEDIE